MSGEHDFPTVRRGSYILMAFAGIALARVLYKGGDPFLVEIITALLAAVSATHAMLVLGGGFNNSTLARPRDNVIEETMKKTITNPPDTGAVNGP